MKINLISISLALLVLMSSSTAEARNKDYTKDLDLGFKDKVRFFMEVGVQGGGESTEALPLYIRQVNGYVGGIDLAVFGQWQGLPSSLDPVFSDSAESGGFYKFAAGVEVPVLENVMIMLSAGYQFDEVYGDLTDGSGGQGSFTYSRATLELIPFFTYKRHRIGLGAELHSSPKGTHKESATGQFRLKSNYFFDDALGFTLRYDYLLSDDLSLGLKLTEMTYDFERVDTRYSAGDTVILDGSFPCIANCEELITADSFGMHLTYRF